MIGSNHCCILWDYATSVIIMDEHEVSFLAIFSASVDSKLLLLQQLLLPCIIAAPECWGLYYYCAYCTSFFVGQSLPSIGCTY
jgi:hypothetical protein